MSLETKLCRIGDELAIPLPAEALQHLGAAEGDTLRLSQHGDHAFRLTSAKKDHQRTMQILESCMDRYSNALSELADS
ncbi:MAG: hypothetical protein ACKOAL_02965 [Chthoniobacterales bacterium]